MKSLLIAIPLVCLTLSTSAQQTMRPVEELINLQEPAWPAVEQLIREATNKVEVLPADPAQALRALYQIQVTTRSPMGAVVYHTGGLLIDGGWIRVLGSGSPRLDRSLPGWNKGKTYNEITDGPPYLVIADDAVGGFFLLNGGGLGSDLGKVYYWAPESLEYQPLDIGYGEFLNFCFTGDLEAFYKGLRWHNWQQEVATLDGNSTFTFFPYLWTVEGKDINTTSRKAVPVDEQYRFNLDARRQWGLEK